MARRSCHSDGSLMVNTTPNHIVVFGKGGVGKSTLSANLSAYYATRGLKALHVGCDPKSDSTLILLEDMDTLSTVMSWIANTDNDREPGAIYNKGRLGIKCIEAGGPEAGIGCGGRGIARVMEFLEKWKVLEREQFDTAVFDVLGDVVCGGFAAPLRKGFGNKVVMVIAEDEMSYFAANNIAKAVLRYSVNGVSMAGVVINERGSGQAALKAGEFASWIGARVLGTLPLSKTPSLARRAGVTAVEYDPDSAFSMAVASIAEALLSLEPSDMPLPTPLDQKAFMKFLIHAESPGGRRPGPDRASLACAREAPAESVDGAPEAPVMLRKEDAAIAGAFSRLLGLRGTWASGPGFDVSRVALRPEGGLRMEFAGPAIGTAAVSLIRKQAGASPAIAAAHFDIFLDQGKNAKPFVRLLQMIAHRLGGFRLQDLTAIYGKCLEQDSPEPDPGALPQQSGPAGSALQWARFFARDQFARNAEHKLFYDIPVTQITHRDIECSFATPQIRSDEFLPYNYPWLSPSLEPDSFKPDSNSKYYETNLGEMDVILGAAEKLSSLIARAISEMGPQKLLLFNNTCVPVVSGEDIPSVVADARQGCPAPLMYQGPENSISLNPYYEFFISLKKEAGFRDANPVPMTVNLIGFPENKGLDEVKAILASMGVHLNAMFLPRLDPGIFDVYRAAALTVFYPDEAYRVMYEDLFGDVPAKAITPPAPYGMRGTREWLDAVAGGLCLSGQETHADTESVREWERLAARAREYTLGFVFQGNAVEMISRPELAGGIPILELIREMGFGIDFLDYTPADTGALNRKPAGDEAGLFSTPEELAERLIASRASCFYSDYYFDNRLAKAGKGQFSGQFFEMGFAGAVRSLGRLLSACEAPFFTRYMKYMAGGAPGAHAKIKG